jgi:hypothetical protein
VIDAFYIVGTMVIVIVETMPLPKFVGVWTEIILTGEGGGGGMRPPSTVVGVGIGVDPRFRSNSAPTIPNYWPFQQHLRSRCNLTQSSNRGLQETGLYNQTKCKVYSTQ